jgi:hypothetical protein
MRAARIQFDVKRGKRVGWAPIVSGIFVSSMISCRCCGRRCSKPQISRHKSRNWPGAAEPENCGANSGAL